jgi:hypothetical protein
MKVLKELRPFILILATAMLIAGVAAHWATEISRAPLAETPVNP